MSKTTKDFDRYVYFISKANNYAVCYQPEIKEVDMYGQQREKQPAIRIEFHNGMKRLEKTKENMVYIDFLREKIKKEENLDPRKRTIWEETPSQVVPKKEHEQTLQKKDKEIETLKKEIEEKNKKGITGENNVQPNAKK